MAWTNRSPSGRSSLLTEGSALGLCERALLIARERSVVLARDVPAEKTPDWVALAGAFRRTPASPTRGVVEPRGASARHALNRRPCRCRVASESGVWLPLLAEYAGCVGT